MFSPYHPSDVLLEGSTCRPSDINLAIKHSNGDEFLRLLGAREAVSLVRSRRCRAIKIRGFVQIKNIFFLSGLVNLNRIALAVVTTAALVDAATPCRSLTLYFNVT